MIHIDIFVVFCYFPELQTVEENWINQGYYYSNDILYAISGDNAIVFFGTLQVIIPDNSKHVHKKGHSYEMPTAYCIKWNAILCCHNYLSWKGESQFMEQINNLKKKSTATKAILIPDVFLHNADGDKAIWSRGLQ